MGFLYLTSIGILEQLRSAKKPEKLRFRNRRCYHHNEMRAEKIGRALGIGLRVAGKMAGQRIAASIQAAETHTNAPSPPPESFDEARAARRADARAAGQSAGRAAGGVARGVGGFLRPFRRVGGILWLEVTGGFFLLFVLVFARAMWLNRTSYASGPGHTRFLGYTVLAAVFLYLGVSSFWRARRR